MTPEVTDSKSWAACFWEELVRKRQLVYDQRNSQPEPLARPLKGLARSCKEPLPPTMVARVTNRLWKISDIVGALGALEHAR
jgi:hypothetical protein